MPDAVNAAVRRLTENILFVTAVSIDNSSNETMMLNPARDCSIHDSVPIPHVQSGAAQFSEQKEGSLSHCWISQIFSFESGQRPVVEIQRAPSIDCQAIVLDRRSPRLYREKSNSYY